MTLINPTFRAESYGEKALICNYPLLLFTAKIYPCKFNINKIITSSYNVNIITLIKYKGETK